MCECSAGRKYAINYCVKDSWFNLFSSNLLASLHISTRGCLRVTAVPYLVFILIPSQQFQLPRIFVPQGSVSRKSRELFGPERLVVKLQSACFEKLIFLHVFNTRKTKFEGFEPRRCEDIRAIVAPERGPKSFGTFDKQAPGPCFSKVSKLFEPISRATSSLICSRCRSSKPWNFAILLVFLTFKTCWKISFTKQVDCSLTISFVPKGSWSKEKKMKIFPFQGKKLIECCRKKIVHFFQNVQAVHWRVSFLWRIYFFQL